MDFIDQDILPNKQIFPLVVNIRRVSQRQADDAVRHLVTNQPLSQPMLPIGIAYHISSTGSVDFLSLANTSMVYIVSFNDREAFPANREFSALLSAGGELPADDDSPCTCLVGFSMARTAVQVAQATRTRVRAVDLSTLFSPDTWEPWNPARIVAERLHSGVDKWKITCLWMGEDRTAERDVCLQAWLAACVGARCSTEISSSLKVDSQVINLSEQGCLSKMIAQADLLESHKPNEIHNDFTRGGFNKFGKFELQNSRYKTRVRRGDHGQTQVVMTDTRGREHVGSAQGAKGKKSTIRVDGNSRSIGELKSVRVVGKQANTSPEKARDELIIHVLTGKKNLRESPFIRSVWFPQWKSIFPNPMVIDHDYASDVATKMSLNDSQREVVHAMVGDMPFVVVHGPPGTGKTTTISAASRIWDLCSLPVWIVAHSNVAVKNIAETLFKKQVNFKLLVSKEFFEEWHEHLYAEVLEKLIRSDELPPNKNEMEKVMAGCHIVLCTLSMLSNPALHDNGTFEIIPVERLIIDEASQINTFEFMHLFEKFQTKLEKVCFFGDPKQLPPFGQEKVPTLSTIFDLKHIFQSDNDFFLNVQYRMPTPIGTFISKHVYEGRLNTQHDIHGSDCVAFIDVAFPRGSEERAGFSSKNPGEVSTIVHLVKNYYRHKNFCVLTPYDAQRADIQKSLENENLPWDTVYNLDSFQGNEADYVLVSVVRSSQPGFLTSLNRMNVLLTRCRKGLVIVSSRSFLEHGGGYNTLIGTLLAYWKVRHTDEPWIDWRRVAMGYADLPGAKAPNLPPPTRTVFPTYSHSSWGNPFPSISQRMPFGIWNGWGEMPSTLPSKSVPHFHISDEKAFPALPKMPLLQGSWASVAMQPPVHKNSLVAKQRQAGYTFAASSYAKSTSISNEPRGGWVPMVPQNPNRGTFQPTPRQAPRGSRGVQNTNSNVNVAYLHSLHPKARSANPPTETKGKVSAKPPIMKQKQKKQQQQPPKPPSVSATPYGTNGFIRGIVVHSKS